jgi:curli biogenesis system outer membrane secretion channel CsgG
LKKLLRDKPMSLAKIYSGLFLLPALFFISCASPPVSSEKANTVAVWDLDDHSPSASSQPQLGELLSSQVIEVIQKRGVYTIVERERLNLALEELRLGTTSLVDETTRLKLGRMVGARFMVFGCYQIIGNQMRLDLRLVEVETGKVLKAVQKTAQGADIAVWLDTARRAAGEL